MLLFIHGVLISVMMIIPLVESVTAFCSKSNRFNTDNPITDLNEKLEIYNFKNADENLDSGLICKKNFSHVVLLNGNQTYRCGEKVGVNLSVRDEMEIGVNWNKEMIKYLKIKTENKKKNEVTNQNDIITNNETILEKKGSIQISGLESDIYHDDYPNIQSDLNRYENELYLMTFSVSNCLYLDDKGPEQLLLWWDAVEIHELSKQRNDPKPDDNFSFIFLRSRFMTYIKLENICKNNNFNLSIFLYHLPPSTNIVDRFYPQDIVDYFKVIHHYRLCDRVVAVNFYQLTLNYVSGFEKPKSEDPIRNDDYIHSKMSSNSPPEITVNGSVWGRNLNFEIFVWNAVICFWF